MSPNILAMQALYANLARKCFAYYLKLPHSYNKERIVHVCCNRLRTLETQFSLFQPPSNDEAEYHAIRREYYADLVASRQRDQKRGHTLATSH